MGVVPIELGPYTEGVNLVDPPVKLSPHELSLCKNWRTGIRGDLYKRPGHDNYGSSPAKINGDNLVNLLLRYYRADGTKRLIGAAGGKLRFGTDSTGAWTAISIDGTDETMSAANLCDWMVYKNRLYITDGVKPQRYNNADDIYAGHFIHVAPTESSQATNGALTQLGVYKYMVTGVTGDMGEGPQGSVLTVTLTGSNDEVNLATISDAASKHEETSKKLWRTKAGGSIFFFLAPIANGVTTYNDKISDVVLEGQGEFVPTHIPPATSRFVLMGHDDRAYWFGMTAAGSQSLVEVSDVGFPDRILDGSASFFTVANNDGDILTGGGLVPGGIVFFKRNSMWLSRAFGFGLINIQPREKRGSGVGTTAPFSVVSTPIGLIFLSQRGEIYLFDGTNISEIGRKIASEFRGMTESSMAKVVACYHDYRYIISYDWRGNKGYNWKTLEYDTRANKWDGPHENGNFFNPSYYSVWDSVLDKGELYWGESRAAAGSFVYGRSEGSKLDRGNKFLATKRTGQIPLGKLGEVKSTKAFVDAEFYSDAALAITHINELGVRTGTLLNSPITAAASKWNDGSNLGPGAPVAKFGGITSTVLEGSLEPCRSRKPMFEITDSGTGVDARIGAETILVEVLAPK